MSRAERRAHERTSPKKRSLWWLYLVLILLALGALAVYNANKPTGVEYEQYASVVDSAYARPNAVHVLEDFSDFQCPACHAISPAIKVFRDTAPDTVRVVYRHFPLRSIHPNAQAAAEASECAREQGRFWAYHDVLMDSKLLDERSLRKHAQGLGLDLAHWDDCRESGRAATAVQRDYLEGTQRGVRGTPTMFINGQPTNARTVADFQAATK
jgi:protein-disulfide isomerase